MRNATALLEMERHGNLQAAESRPMGFHSSGLAMAWQILSNMYSNGPLAAVREYACNARDSHVEAGQTLPIEVTLPSPLVPQLKVQDYGVGLDHDEILEVYSQYFASTKRNTNEQIGAFGLGSKSAFTVGNQFTVTGVKNGRKTVALFSLTEEGPMVEILSAQEATSEPNGVLVDIGIENVSAVREAAMQLFRTWQPGTVLVDGEEPDLVWSKSSKIADKVWLRLGTGENLKITVVMGGVGYTVNNDVVGQLGSSRHSWVANNRYNIKGELLLEVGIGDVDITPSREELRSTPRTVDAVDGAVEQAIYGLHQWVAKQIEDAPTFTHAAMRMKEFVNELAIDPTKVSYRGTPFGSKVVHTGLTSFGVQPIRRRYGSKPGLSKWKVETYDNQPVSLTVGFDRYVVVTSTPKDKVDLVRRYSREFLGDYADAKRQTGVSQADVERVLVSHNAHAEIEWWSFGKKSPVKTITYNRFRAEALERQKKNRVSGPGSAPKTAITYTTTMADGTVKEATVDELNGLNETILFERGTRHRHNNPAWGLIKGRTLVTLTAQQRIEVFQKRVPNNEGAYTAALAATRKVLAKLPQDTIKEIEANSFYSAMTVATERKLAALKDKITTKSVLDHIRLFEEARDAVNSTGAQQRIEKVAQYQLFAVNAIPTNVPDNLAKEVSFIRDEIPLFWAITEATYYRYDSQSAVQEHLIKYINGLDTL